MPALTGEACKSKTVPVPVNVSVLHDYKTVCCPPTRMYTCPDVSSNPGTDVSLASHQVGSLPAPTPQPPLPPANKGCLHPTAQGNKSKEAMGRDASIAAHEERIRLLWPEPTLSARKSFPVFCDMYSKIKATAKPNCFGAKIPLASDLVIPAWRRNLVGYHDTLLCDYLEFGWPLGYHGNSSPETTDKNHPSGEAFLPQIEEFIAKELQHKAVLGPFHHPPFEPWVRCSPIMTRPKRDSEQRRVILDLSYPKGSAVNDGIEINNHFGQDISYTLPTIADLAQKLTTQGTGAFLWKADLSRAYRQLRADPLDAPLLGLKVGADTYIDLCPPFGCRSSAAICQRMANALVYIMGKKGFHILAYLDDFGACFASQRQARDSFKAFQDLTKELGLSLATQKSVPPTHEMEWLGYTVNSNAMSITIPPKKLNEVLQDCRNWLDKTRANKQTIQSMVGRLVYVSNCVLPGRKFISRILGTLRAMGDREWTTLTKEFKADLRWFIGYAEKANGLCLINPFRPVFNIECDASLLGAGGNSGSQCYQWVFSTAHLKTYTAIHHLEAINVVVAIRTLIPSQSSAPLLINIWTDNSASAWALQTGRTKDQVLAACAREIWLIASISNHTIAINHKPGVDIPLADALSRAAHNTAKARLADSIINRQRPGERMHRTCPSSCLPMTL